MRFQGLLGLLAAASLGGCTSAGETCVGGVVLDGGECIAKCDPNRCVAGNRCVNNECKLVCESFLDCTPGSQDCVEATEDTYADGGGGGTIKICADSGHPAGIGEACPVGDECDGDLTCITQGEGDGDAYCAEVGCMEDSDCAPGYRCGVSRDPRRICGTSKGDNDICGQTGDPCVNAEDLEHPYFEGPACILRYTCVKPAPCAPCETDLDCAAGGDMACVDIDDEMRCAERCADDIDCKSDATCEGDVCKPRFGSCVGGGELCEPCVDDRDCGDASGPNFCMEFPGNQFACSAMCAGAIDCLCGDPPSLCLSPGNVPVYCLNAGYCGGISGRGLVECWEP
jgi:hypothetical protein